MDATSATSNAQRDEAPAESSDLRADIAKYIGGFVLSVLLTLASFWAAGTTMVWQPGVPILLAALAIGQMGVHLVFFLHVSSGPEATNNILALAFGVFVVALVVFGSIVIMANLDANMMPMEHLMQIQR
ncbi:MAG: cytochrome o ubiquinol oxidase subunit IV [Rhizobacter sp.]|nr:cytochrome o ubiquinol oxidase subunit IV [Rhizobacter sp.]